MSFLSRFSCKPHPAIFWFGCLFVILHAAPAQVRLGPPFGDHMVLQSGVPVSIWGSGCPGGDTVKLAVGGQSVSTRSDWQGNWLVRLAPMKPGGPYQMNIQIGGSGKLVVSSAATDHGGAEINDVLIGKVILIPQSANTASISRPVPAGQHPFAQVRVFRAGDSVETTYSGHSAAQWVYVAQDNLPAGTAAYFDAGRTVQEQQQIPVGVIVVAPAPACKPPQSCPALVQTTQSIP